MITLVFYDHFGFLTIQLITGFQIFIIGPCQTKLQLFCIGLKLIVYGWKYFLWTHTHIAMQNQLKKVH